MEQCVTTLHRECYHTLRYGLQHRSHNSCKHMQGNKETIYRNILLLYKLEILYCLYNVNNWYSASYSHKCKMLCVLYRTILQNLITSTVKEIVLQYCLLMAITAVYLHFQQWLIIVSRHLKFQYEIMWHIFQLNSFLLSNLRAWHSTIFWV